MKLPQLKIGDLKVKLPIIQGGMGIGVSKSRLAAAVANEGGIGVISGVQIGYDEPDFITNTLQANIRALRREIRKAKEQSPNGIIGLNLMVAMNNYKEMVTEAVKEKIDIIISGAGLPIDLPKLVKGSVTKIVPIVSSAKAARVIMRRWEKLKRVPDAIIVEGAKAGGHLGFKAEELVNKTNQKLEDIVTEVIKTAKPFEDKYNTKIPVIAAGGIFSGDDISKMLSVGADGVQMGSRFVATYECDASDQFKRAYIDAREEDISIIKSPVGMPGRAIINDFIRKTQNSKEVIKKCYNCIINCNPAKTPYCISNALIQSVNGKEGLVFCGERVGEIKELVSVKKLIQKLKEEVEDTNKE